MSVVSFWPIQKSLTVDPSENYAYVASNTNPLDIVRFGSSTGSIVDSQRYSFLNGQSLDIKIHPISDSSGYYVTGSDTLNIANICKYLFSTAISQCQKISNFYQYAYGQLKLSDTTLFILGYDHSSPYSLYFYKHNFGSISPDWSLKLLCPSGTCLASLSESLLVSSFIYTFFAYGSTQYVYMAVMSSSNGSVNNRYKSSMSCTNVKGSGISGDYVAASVLCSSAYLLMFNRATNVFTTKSFIGTFLYGIGLEAATNRLVIVGWKNPNGYTTKFTPQSLSAHPDFQITATWTMNVLSSGTEEILIDSSQSIGVITDLSVGTPSPMHTNITVTYVPEDSYTSDVNYLTSDQSISVSENTEYQKTPDLLCSISGSTSISFSIANYLISAPSWVTINSSSGVLSISSPEVSSDTEFDFYINSNVSGVSSQIQKVIKLTILNCTISNCQKCISTSSITCEVCSSGYIFDSGTCKANSKEASKISQALSITTTGAVIIITAITTISCIMSVQNITSLWMTINQLQLFLLLLLTRAFIPIDIQSIISGSEFSSNLYNYFSFKKLSFFPNFLSEFRYEKANSSLQLLGIEYVSTFANTSSIIVYAFIMIFYCIFVYLLRIFLAKFKESQKCFCTIKILHWITDRICKIIIFGYFIRSTLEVTQFVLISSINEINQLNTSSFYNIFSLFFSFIMVISFLVLIALVVYLIASSYRLDENRHNMLEEFFRGLKKDKKYWLYTPMLLLRRLLFILLLIILTMISSRFLIAAIIAVQVAYFICLSYLRPYEQMKENLIEILNETYFGFLIVFLVFINTEDEWNSIKTSIYMWVLASNTIIVFLIVLVFLIKMSITWISRKCKANEQSIDNAVRVIPKQCQTNNPRDLKLKTNNKQKSSLNQDYSVSNQLVEETKSNANLNYMR